MRKELQAVVFSDFAEALSIVGYRRLYPRLDPCPDWRRGSFHLILRKKGKNRLVVRLHEEVFSRVPPFHRPKFQGKEVRAEMDLIVEAYKRKRLTRRGGI